MVVRTAEGTGITRLFVFGAMNFAHWQLAITNVMAHAPRLQRERLSYLVAWLPKATVRARYP